MKKTDNPLNMIRDPFDGQTFIMPETLCTNARKRWFHLANEIIAFQFISTLALQECKSKYVKIGFKPETPIKIGSHHGPSLITNAHQFVNFTNEGITILNQQVYIKLYGAFETYLFDMLEKSFQEIGTENNSLELSKRILMNKSWDGKFCSMNDTFKIGYKSAELIAHFSSFDLNHMGMPYKNPLDFLDELAEFRHRIIHAAGIIDQTLADKYPDAKLETGRSICLPNDIFIQMFAFYSLLTEYVDKLFAQTFRYSRHRINPAQA